MFYYETPWFYQDFKNENLRFFKSVLSWRSENTGPVSLEVILSPLKWGMKHIYKFKDFSLLSEQV